MKILIKLFLLFSITTCAAQTKVIDYSGKKEINYILSNLKRPHKLSQPIYNGAYFLSVYEITDSRASIKNLNESEEIFSSIFISLTPDGDYYTTSRLYKIERLMNPEIISIEEMVFPKLEISIEHGNQNYRKIDKLVISGEF